MIPGRGGAGGKKRGGHFKIEPFRHKVDLDPQYAEKTWKVLEDAIHEIHNHNAFGLSFEELYRNAYNMVLHKFGDRLYKGLEDTITAHLVEVSKKIDVAQGLLFLEETNKRWEDHNKSMQMIRDILMYMDRTYVNQHGKTPVHELGLKLWRDTVVRCDTIKPRLSATLLELIQKERSGETIDRALVRCITKMLMDLGTQVYCEDFERPFLEASADFYKVESQEYIASSDCPAYLKKAEQRLNEETARVSHYLDPSTETKITTVVEKELVGTQVKILVDLPNSGLVALMKDDKFDDLERMFCLFRRGGVLQGLSTMRDSMSEYLRETGKHLVLDPERIKDPVEYVQRLLDERDKMDDIIKKSFHNDKTFQHTLNQGVSEEEVEVVLDKVMMLFRYLQEKDVFEKYYKQHLAKRLLPGRSMSDDAERSLLVKAFEYFINLNPRSPEFISLFVDDKLRKGLK
eukprot:gene23528-28485_t